MIIFPAIDLLDGKWVRLILGDYNQEVVYSDSAVELAKVWEAKGADFIHIVDLNGAKSGESVNKTIIEKIAKAVSIPVQVGGGVRSIETIENYIKSGVDRAIIGTPAINDKEFLREAVKRFADHLVVSVDARSGYVATEGWTDTSDVKALDLVIELESMGVKTIVYTDIAKDGMLEGPNLDEQAAINRATSIDVIASGGITTPQDITNLEELNIYGAIIGKALYDGKLDFEKLMTERNGKND